MSKLNYIPVGEISRIREKVTDQVAQCEILSDVFRFNALYMILQAGSGHVGTCFSSMDILTWLWLFGMKNPNDPAREDSDLFFSSKGHDVPALYSILIGLGRLDLSYLHQLRRLHGLPGHPDIHTPNIITNTGSLGMGISKAKGLAWANRLAGKKSRIFVLSGDGELQAGQIWESLQPAANNLLDEIILIVDHNKIQSDIWVEQVSPLGDLEKKFSAFGWEVARCDGHDFSAIKICLDRLSSFNGKPKVLIADTIKGGGVSVFEATGSGFDNEYYKFHSGAPQPEYYEKAVNELFNRINGKLANFGLEKINLKDAEMDVRPTLINPQRLLSAYEDELVKIGEKNNEVVVLDADLLKDCGLKSFKERFPNRFFECGIAEQDMVSAAGGLALKKMLPLVHSFACFLSTRPNEQIYNNASEETKIIYVGSLAGILPATPGHSHQSVRDISVLGSIPKLMMIQPADEKETRLALNWAINKYSYSVYLRLASLPCEIPYALPDKYVLEQGKGVILNQGEKLAIIAYGPVLLSEAYRAALTLKQDYGLEIKIINMPWLNEIDPQWLTDNLKNTDILITLDDHYRKLGQGDMIRSASAGLGSDLKIISLGIEDIPQCGQAKEILEYYHLDSASLVKLIKETI